MTLDSFVLHDNSIEPPPSKRRKHHRRACGKSENPYSVVFVCRSDDIENLELGEEGTDVEKGDTVFVYDTDQLIPLILV